MTWQEEFDKKFGVSHGKQEIPERTWENYGELKSFIQKTREDAVREILEKVEKQSNYLLKTDKRTDEDIEDGIGYDEYGYDAVYNQAILDVLSILNKHKNI